MRKILAFWLAFLLVGIAYADTTNYTDRSVEHILNDVWDDTNNALRTNISGDVTADSVQILDWLSVDTWTSISGDLTVYGNTYTKGLLTALSIDTTSLTADTIVVHDWLSVDSNTSISGDLHVYGNISNDLLTTISTDISALSDTVVIISNDIIDMRELDTIISTDLAVLSRDRVSQDTLNNFVSGDTIKDYVSQDTGYLTQCNVSGDVHVGINNVILDDAGRIGIGIVPSTPWHIATSNATCYGYYDTYDDASTTSTIMYLRKSSSDTIGTQTITNAGNLGEIIFAGVNDVNNFTGGAKILVTQTRPSSTKAPCDMVLQTSNTATANTNQLYLDEDDNIGVGRESIGFKLDVWEDGNDGCLLAENDGTSSDIVIAQNGILNAGKYGLHIYSDAAQVNEDLALIEMDNATSSTAALNIQQDGTGNALECTSGDILVSNGMVRLTARASSPDATGTAGLYVESATNRLLYYDGSNWHKVSLE